MERRLHASRFRDICAVVWRHDELGNHVQFKCNFDEKAALALEREVGAGGECTNAVWEGRPRCSDVSVDVGVTRFGEVSFRVSFSPAVAFDERQEAWARGLCALYMRLVADVATGSEMRLR